MSATTGGSPGGAQPRKQRAHFVDILKLIVAFQMINGHTLHALMVDELRSGTFFNRYTHFRGLVSVSFLLSAGFAFYLATVARFEAHRSDPNAVRKRFTRALILIGFGYLLRYSEAIWSSNPDVAARGLTTFIRCDVLQCIGITLMALEAMTVLAKRGWQVAAASGVMAVGIFAAAPFVDPAVAVDGPWRALTSYLSHQGGSLFPLLPWSGYMFAGVALASITLSGGVGEKPLPGLLRLSGVAIGVSVIAYIMLEPGFPRPPRGYHPAASPAHIMQKLAEVMVAMAVLHWMSHRITRLPRVLSVLSRETLTLYIVHLMLLYRWPVPIIRVFGKRSLELPEALSVSAMVVVFTVALTLAKHAIWKRGFTLPPSVRSALRAAMPRRGSAKTAPGQ